MHHMYFNNSKSVTKCFSEEGALTFNFALIFLVIQIQTSVLDSFSLARAEKRCHYTSISRCVFFTIPFFSKFNITLWKTKNINNVILAGQTNNYSFIIRNSKALDQNVFSLALTQRLNVLCGIFLTIFSKKKKLSGIEVIPKVLLNFTQENKKWM